MLTRYATVALCFCWCAAIIDGHTLSIFAQLCPISCHKFDAIILDELYNTLSLPFPVSIDRIRREAHVDEISMITLATA